MAGKYGASSGRKIVDATKNIQYYNRAYGYAEGVVSGSITACKWLKIACQQWLDDFDKIENDDYEFTIDVKKGGDACHFIETIPQSRGKGAKYKKNIVLMDWQVFIVFTIFSWVKKDTGHRRFREVYLKVPRKNGKTELGSAIGLYMGFVEGEEGAEIYCGGRSKEQALKCLKAAKAMLKRKPILCSRFGIKPYVDYILGEKYGSKFKPLIGNPEDGDDPYLYICDEFHEHRTNDQFSTMETGMGAREEALILVITTAGKLGKGPCFEYELNCRAELQSKSKRSDLFVVIYQADEDDNIFDIETIKKANPAYGVIGTPGFYESRIQKARLTPRFLPTYKSKFLNIWSGDEESFFDQEKWVASSSKNLMRSSDKRLDIDALCEPFKGRRVWLGYDGSARRDCTALAIIAHNKRGGFDIATRIWLPSGTLEEYREKDPVRLWADDGWICVTEGSMIDFEQVSDEIKQIGRLLNVVQLGYNPARAMVVIKDLMKDFDLVEISQGPVSMNEPMELLDGWIVDDKISHDGNEMMNFMVGNVRADPFKELKRPTKSNPMEKIDGISALLGAVKVMENTPPVIDHYFGTINI